MSWLNWLLDYLSSASLRVSALNLPAQQFQRIEGGRERGKGKGEREIERKEKREGRVKGRERERERKAERGRQTKMHSRKNTITTTLSTYMLTTMAEFHLRGDLGPLCLFGGGPQCDWKCGDLEWKIKIHPVSACILSIVT